jgi:hypothetical protein
MHMSCCLSSTPTLLHLHCVTHASPPPPPPCTPPPPPTAPHTTRPLYLSPLTPPSTTHQPCLLTGPQQQQSALLLLDKHPNTPALQSALCTTSQPPTTQTHPVVHTSPVSAHTNPPPKHTGIDITLVRNNVPTSGACGQRAGETCPADHWPRLPHKGGQTVQG